jgi:hypothetical protein
MHAAGAHANVSIVLRHGRGLRGAASIAHTQHADGSLQALTARSQLVRGILASLPGGAAAAAAASGGGGADADGGAASHRALLSQARTSKQARLM